MVAKLIVWDVDREKATQRMLRALGEYEIEPLTTLIPFHKAILATEQWAKGETARDLTEDKKWLKALEPPPEASSASLPGTSGPGQDGEVPSAERTYQVEVNGRLHAVKVIGTAAPVGAAVAPAAVRRPPRRERSGGGGGGAAGPTLSSPLQGSVFKVAVEQGAEVEEGALICVIEAMKMENEITAHRAGKVTELAVKEGDSINAGDPICTIE
jgi:acetyl-CoA/propionyl-CoA carboxylase biotin carboxyl carrier protein